MATIIDHVCPRQSSAATAAWIAEQLQEVFDFVNVVEGENTTDLYYSQDFYLRITVSSQSYTIKVCGPEGFDECSLFTSGTYNLEQYVRIVKTAKGDVALLATALSSSGTVGIADNSWLVFVLAKCKHAVTGEEGWGVYVPNTCTQNQNFYTKLFVTEGTTNTNDNRINAIYVNASITTKGNVLMGYNPLAPITVLIPIFAVSSAYISENTFIMHITPRMYNGDTVINGKHYYCVGLIAMLDEGET